MKEYVINCGDFNIIVLPQEKRYFIIDETQADTLAAFVAGAPVDYSSMPHYWFKYGVGEVWHGFDASEHRLNEGLSEEDLIANFVLKKFNFGSLVALRDSESGRVQVFKRDKLPAQQPA